MGCDGRVGHTPSVGSGQSVDRAPLGRASGAPRVTQKHAGWRRTLRRHSDARGRPRALAQPWALRAAGKVRRAFCMPNARTTPRATGGGQGGQGVRGCGAGRALAQAREATHEQRVAAPPRSRSGRRTLSVGRGRHNLAKGPHVRLISKTTKTAGASQPARGERAG